MIGLQLAILSLLMVYPVLAQTSPEEAVKPIVDVINRAIRALQVIAGSIAVGMLVYAGILYMTSGEDPQQELKIRRLIRGVIIGLAIVALAEVIRNVVINLIGAS